MKHLLPLLLLLVLGCQDKVLGLTDNATPLVHIHVKVTGDLQALRPESTLKETPHLRVALVWGGVYNPDPFCGIYQVLPLDPSATAVAQAGCRDIFGFVPQQVGESVAVAPDGTATIDLINLPNAAVLVGEVTSRVGYASILVFDDRNNNGTLELHRAAQNRNGGGPGGGPGGMQTPDSATPTTLTDFVYGASFISQTQPDQRIAYLEGTFDANNALYGLFYPRTGCATGPTTGFSILSAGGFAPIDGLKALAGVAGDLEDPATCSVKTLDAVIEIPLQATETVRDPACTGGGSTGVIRYSPPSQPGATKQQPQPDLTQPWACMPIHYSPCLLGVPIPGLDCSAFDATSRPALAVAAVPSDCKSTTHYILKGCQNDANCETPDWDFTTAANPPPAWWPCATGVKP